ncbi:hypothetical protein [Hydrogenophaga taeniospiralis]|uniref:hypothetical protein n=1 Tax=Hydrogenophaga taeniospiralis TaxID=65656 RepID=UPI001CF9D5A1|nr:hypothetical protein [Hydrogenophaga taeniospiralis]UCU92309.1 hypothetical protein KI616_15800 [Hydrogenophaga taeniospiralis]
MITSTACCAFPSLVSTPFWLLNARRRRRLQACGTNWTSLKRVKIGEMAVSSFAQGKTVKIFFKVAALAVAISTLAACGGGDDSKDLFSLWTRDDDGGRVDLSGGTLGAPFVLSTFDSDASQCNCTFHFIGTQDSGRLVINQCYFVSSPTGRDPGCSTRGGVGDYSKSGDILTYSGPLGTFTYR